MIEGEKGKDTLVVTAKDTDIPVLKVDHENKVKSTKEEYDLKEEETTVKDLTEPLHNLVEGPKETRKAASQAKKRIENFASNKGNNFFNSSPNEKANMEGDPEKVCKSSKVNCSPSQRELEHKKSMDSV